MKTITISRQYGSGGRTIGEMLAKKLGWSFYDKQIIHMASDESGIDVGLFGKVEGGDSIERQRSIVKGNKNRRKGGYIVKLRFNK